MPIRSSVTVSLVPEARGGPFVFWDDLPAACRKARELGFDGVEIFPGGPADVSDVTVRNLLDDHGLGLAAVGTGAGWVRHRLTLTSPDAAVREKARAFVRSIIDAAGALGAPAIIGSMQGRHGDGVDRAAAFGYLSEALEELGEAARTYGLPLVYEPLNRYETNMVNTLADGVALLGTLSTKNVVLLADLFHMNIEEEDVAGALRIAGPHVGHVHFVDSNRRPPGYGHTNFLPVAEALGETGYGGYASAEAFSYPDPDAAAVATIRVFQRVFGNGR